MYATRMQEYCQLHDLDLPGVLDAHMYKNILQEYTQKTLLELPKYHTVKVNEGPLHKTKFRCTVTVQNTPYTSPHTFSEQKSAEQDAARIALKCLHLNPKVQDITFSKSILHEYAAKMYLDQPSYQTIQEKEGLLPVFMSTVHFHGVSYCTRVKGGTKKEAEQLAARFAIRNILGKGNSESVKVMSRIIQSKFNTRDINGIFSVASSVVDSQVTSGIVDNSDRGRGSLQSNILRKEAANLYPPIHPSKKRNLGIQKQAVDPGIEFIPSMHTLVEKLRAKGREAKENP